AFDLVLPARARGQDQHGELLALAAQGLDQLHAGHLRQAEVDDAEVERHFAAHVQALFTILGGVHGERFALQAWGQGLPQRGVVFDEEDTHGSTPESGAMGASIAYSVVVAACRGPLRRVVHEDADPAVFVDDLDPVEVAALVGHAFGAQHLAAGPALDTAHA